MRRRGVGVTGRPRSVGWVICWPRVSWWRRCRAVGRGRLHGSHRARRATMQHVQISLLPEQDTGPVPQALGQLPAAETAEVIRLLAGLVATAAAVGVVAGDE